MLTVPPLPPHCNSWIIARDGVAVLETYSRKFAEHVAQAPKPGVEIYTAADWLGRLNGLHKAR